MRFNINAPKRLIIICGHFGSGKTNVSVGLAKALAESGKKVTLVDLDIVNPYFRAADASDMLSGMGVKCINPQFANTSVDVPSLGPEIQSVFLDDRITIFDVGGDNGAAALGRYKREFDRLGYDMYCVVSKYRPLTDSPEAAVDDIAEIEAYARLKCTGIVNNSNLGRETTRELVEDSFAYADRITEMTGLPLVFTSVVEAPYCSGLENEHPDMPFFFMENSTRKIF